MGIRIIDANALLDKHESLYMKGHVLFHGITAFSVENAPTIDPETLPLVQELRKQLEQVTAERDAAIEDIPKICKTCKYGKSPCDWCKFDADGDLNWEWRGPIAKDKTGGTQ